MYCCWKVPPAAALVFLVAGPATNVATIGAIFSAFGRRTTIIYVSTVVFGILILGSVFSFVVPVCFLCFPTCSYSFLTHISRSCTGPQGRTGRTDTRDGRMPRNGFLTDGGRTDGTDGRKGRTGRTNGTDGTDGTDGRDGRDGTNGRGGKYKRNI